MRSRYTAVLVGNGTMGKRHKARFEACGVEFVAVADNRNEFDKAVDKLNANFAVIASPAATHYAYVKFFLERRVPVFVEKPLATTPEEAQELVDLAARNGTTLFVAQSECYNPLFLNFRKHFLEELKTRASDAQPEVRNVRLEFRREHRRSERCRDVNAALDLLVHDLSLFLTLFRLEDVEVDWFKTGKRSGEAADPAFFDSARMRLSIARGPYAGVIADFYVNRVSDCDVRTISVDFARIENLGGQGGTVPETSYTVSLVRYTREGEIEHVPDSLDNEHRFFLKLLAGACVEWGRRAAQNAADCVKLACTLP